MDENVLISKLESSDYSEVRSHFSDYLAPFSDLTNPKKTKRTAKQRDDHKSLARSLAKKFLPFINRALATLPKRLADPPGLGGGEKTALELFEIYRLCLGCLESVSSELSGKPYAVHFQRLRMIRGLEAWGRWRDAESECFGVLEKLKEVSASGKSESFLLPNADKSGGDLELGSLVVEIVVSLVKCVSGRQSKDARDYRLVVRLLEESRCWFRVLDASTYEKLHRVLVTYVGRSAIFLLGEFTYMDVDLACEFCTLTLAEYAKSWIIDQIFKIAGRMCSSLFSRQDGRPAFSIRILMCIMDSLIVEGKIAVENNVADFVELIAYCANKCQANPDFCSMIGAHLNKLAETQVKVPLNLIMRLYATGLLTVDYKLRSNGCDMPSSEDVVRTLCSGDLLLDLAALLCTLRSYVHKGSERSCVSSSVICKNDVCLLCSPYIPHNEDSTSRAQKRGNSYTLIYLDALKFLCMPLAEVISSEKKLIISESGCAVSTVKLCHAQEAFYQFYDAFFFSKRIKYTYESEKDGFDKANILGIAVASYIVSLGTKLNTQRSVHLLKDAISSEWVQPNELKHLFTSLYNVGVILYRNGQLKEALKALKLSCRSLWTYVLHLCDMYSHKSDFSSGDLSEDAIVNFVNDACTRSAFLLNALRECDMEKVKGILIKSLKNWLVAADLFSKLPGPMPLVKLWVKIECKTYKNADAQDTGSSLYSFLSPAQKASKKTIGTILEQELYSYEEVHALYPDLCQKMQMKVIGYLLNDVYATPESWLQRSKILVQKGRVLRLNGHCLEDCIQCLSDAIFSIQTDHGEPCNYSVQSCHQLALAYCLRAFCTQEADPNSKQVILDIKMALKLWLSTAVQDSLSAKEKCFVELENLMIILYGIVDLLSLKGCMDYHYDIYRLMFRLFQWKNVPIERSLAVLWECRRLSHALCVSPVNEAILTSMAEQYGGQISFIDFWISCLKGSKALQVGFEHNFSFLFSNFPRGSLNHESSILSNITLEEVKNAAFRLISNDPTSSSVFVAGYLFYDMSERLTSYGRTAEALTYAKEAQRLRTKLFEEKFKFSMEQQPENSNGTAEVLPKVSCGIKDLQLRRSVAKELWSCNTISWDMENCYLSPWAILQCYLESTLQVGVTCEIIGDVAEAEGLFLWGKDISCLQNLPLFIATFSSFLGKLYCKKQLWDLAEKELHSAKQYLEVNNADISCLKCRLMLNSTVDQYLGDLSIKIIEKSSEMILKEDLSHAEALYKSAFDTLNCADWKSPASIPEVACLGSIVVEKALSKDAKIFVANIVENQEDMKKPSRRKPKENQELKLVRKTRNSSKTVLNNQDPMPANNLKTTRPRNWSSKSKYISSEVQVASCTHLHSIGENECSGTCDLMKVKSSIGCGSEGKNRMRCWHCLQMEVANNGLLNDFVDMKWEFFRRKLSVRLLTSLGSCLESDGRIHEAHEVYLQSILILVNLDSLHLPTSSVPDNLLLDIIGNEVSEDMLSVERAELLYNVGWLSLKSYRSRGTRVSCCNMSTIQLPKLVDWLMLAFILCSEVPTLFQKVCRLLALIFLLSGEGKLGSLSSLCKALSENRWASYFHQASIGTHHNYQLCTNHDRTSRVKHPLKPEDSDVTGSTCLGAEMQNLPRLAPKSKQDLEEFVVEFFAEFRCTTTICISFLEDPYTSLLQEMLQYQLCTGAWMLLSRLDFQSQPLVLLLPIDFKVEEASEDTTKSDVRHCSENKLSDKHWQCPWGSTMVDKVAPEFRLILEENYISSSVFTSEDTPESRKVWWTWRKDLDNRLGKFLGNLEDSWLGPWKCLLLGQRSDHKSLESIQKKLARSLKTKCKMDVNENLLSIILGDPKDVLENEEFILHLCSRKGCYIGRTERQGVDRSCPSSNNVGAIEKSPGLALKLIHEAVNIIEDGICADREPIILVLDFDVQMLPWENLPVLRTQEVYRMPSIWSISESLQKNFWNQDQYRAFPCIDPLDAFYLLNPSGDLSSTQTTFEKWFREQNFEGMAGYKPTAEELAAALKSHDLFLYFGHGSGAQYIPGRKIQKLENCAATLLMGCSSGSLTLNGCYAPHGTPLCYLIAGSPVIVANLWEVTDKDIDRFGKAVLDAWFKERIGSPSGCDQCSLVAEELEALSLKGRIGNNTKKKVSKKASLESCEVESIANRCDHRPRIGSFMGQAREACTLTYLIGAAPVCYGVPTGIRNKRDLKQNGFKLNLEHV